MKLFNRIHRCLVLGWVVLATGLGSTHAAGQMIHADHGYPVSPGVPGWDHYGASVATNGEFMAVGAWNPYSFPDHIPEQGAVYLYDAVSSELVRTLYPEDAVPFGQFGLSIDMDEDRLVVGAPESWGGIQTAENSGAAYLIDASTGEQMLTLEPADPNIIGGFGHVVAIDNGLVAVWGQTIESEQTRYGSVFIFDATTGEQVRKFNPVSNYDESDPYSPYNGSFGHSMDLQDGVLAVNERVLQDDELVGVVKLFDVGTGALINQLSQSDPGDTLSFGYSISMDDGIVAVSTMEPQPGEDRRGAVYTFDAQTGDELIKYTPACCGYFHISDNADVKIKDGVVAIGFFDSNYLGGVVHLFDAQSGDLRNVLKPTRSHGFDMFEISIAMGDGVIGVAHSDEDEMTTSGAMYFFGSICSADLTLDDQLDFLDLSAFVSAYVGGHFEADFNNDQSFDFLDISAFIDAYTTGCP